VTTLRLKPNSRKTPPLTKSAVNKTEWEFEEVGVMRHKSGFTIQFFDGEECDITKIPKDMTLPTIRELTSKAIKARSRRFRT